MTNPVNVSLQSLNMQAQEQSLMVGAQQRAHMRENAAFSLELQRLQTDRAIESSIRKNTIDVIADILTSLKKTGAEVRQSN